MQPASGGSDHCQFNPAANTVVIQIPSDDNRGNGVRRDGDSIVYRDHRTHPYEECSGATVHNTDRIEFHGGTRDDAVEIDLSFGSFAPGATSESSGKSEIEFFVVPDPRVVARVGIRGSGRAESIVCLGGGIALNGDEDTDFKSVGRLHKISVWSGAGKDSIDFSECERLRGLSLTSGGGADRITGSRHAYLFVKGGSGNDKIRSLGDGLFTGDSGDDVLRGGSDRDSIYGGKGDDILFGLEGDDHLLYGQRGHDRLYGGKGDDRMWDTFGNDRLWGQAGHDRIDAGDGEDHVIAGAGDDNVRGHAGDDDLEGSRGDDEIFGEEGNDHLDGDAGNDLCEPGPGNNTKEDCER